MDMDRLIEYVKQHVFLYDVNDTDYKNVALKAATWEAIGKELNQTGEAAKSRWKTVRDGYRKYKKLEKTGKNKKNSQYIWSSRLGFLDEVNQTTNEVEAEVEAPNSPNQDSDNSEFTPPPSNKSLPSPSQEWTETAILSDPLQSTYNSHRSKRPQLDDVDDVFSLLSKRQKMEYDAVDYLFLSYAETFKKFPPRQQAMLKLELAKLFADTELSLLKGEAFSE